MKSKGENIFLLLLFFTSCAGLYIARQWPRMSRLYPTITLMGAILFSGGLLVSQFFSNPQGMKRRKPKENIPLRNELISAGWVLGYLAIVLIFGYWVASALFPLLFLSIFGRENWKLVGIYSALTCLAVYLIFSYGLKLYLYPGIFRIGF